MKQQSLDRQDRVRTVALIACVAEEKWTVFKPSYDWYNQTVCGHTVHLNVQACGAVLLEKSGVCLKMRLSHQVFCRTTPLRPKAFIAYMCITTVPAYSPTQREKME